MHTPIYMLIRGAGANPPENYLFEKLLHMKKKHEKSRPNKPWNVI